jgi:putative DNA primase/helicase
MAYKPDSEKKSYSETVANKIIEQLEQGTAPWQKPWQPGELELPHNPTTGKEYKGINALWLHMQGRDDPRWMTYNQAGNEGAQVRKGEKGSQIVYWKFSDEKKETDEQGKPVIDPETGKQKTITVQLERPRSFTAVVFNAEQIDGLPPREPRVMRSEPERHARAEAVLTNSGADIRHEEGNRAFYRPSTDSITLPERSQFPTSDNYYATALHEVGHWTGHPSRLDRDLSNPFGSEGYAREELRAEIASLMIGERLDIGHDPGQHAAYVGSWIKALKEDPREIFRAAADAERISAFVMGFEHEKAQDQALDRQPAQAASAPRAVLHEQPEKAMETRTYLAVPYAEKNEAKAEGAKWDKEAKAWYAEAGVDVATSGLARWSLDKPGVVKAAEPDTPEKQFMQALKDAGLDTQAASDKKDHPVADGKIHRVPTTGEKGGTSGAYAFHKDPQTDGTFVVGGFIQNYKTGEVVHWKPEGKSEQLTAEQRAEQATQAANARLMREDARNTENDATAKAAKALWDESPPATADNAYCKTKGITDPKGVREVPATVSPEAAALGIKIAKTAKQAKELREADPNNRVFKEGDLLIPGLDSSGKLHTLQSVNPYFKSLMKGGRKAGLFSVAGADDPIKAIAEQDAKNPLVIAEGYATADTVSRLKGGGPVVVAFDSGNLSAVADELRGRFPNRGLLFAADNDHNAEKQTGFDGKPKINVGLVKAKEAAEKHGGGVIVPKFKDGDKGSDWNDVATASGDEAARRMFGEEMAVAKRDAAISAERLTSLARTRDMEARNDPTTSADDAKVATERGHASEVLAGAQSQLTEVRSMAADGLTGNAKGNVKGAAASAAVKAGISRKTEAMHDKANEEREQVLNHPQGADGAAVSWKKLPEQAKQTMIEAVKAGKEVTLPKDAPAQLKKMAGQEPAPRSRSRGLGIEM